MSKIQAQGVHHITADVLATAHRLRVAAGAYNIQDAHLSDAIAELTKRNASSITEVVLA